jgi:hypothetical protein
MDVIIDKIKGLDKEIYLTIGPIVMSKKGMTYFENYPVITSSDHIWYVVKDMEGYVCAFAAIVYNKTVYSLREVYLDSDKCPRVKVFTMLLDAIMKDVDETTFPVSSFCRAEDYELWKPYGFEATYRQKNWYTLRREPKK